MPAFPVGMPDSQALYIEFVAGTWTLIPQSHVELVSEGPLVTQFGRTSVYSQPGPGSMTVTLKNDAPFGNGRYTPQRQVLADGVTAHPYWPNVLPRKRIKRTYTEAGVEYTKFVGHIKGWPPALESGVRPVVTITATTADDRLSRVKLQSPIRQQIGQSFAFTPVLWWPLTDDAGATQAVQAPVLGPYPLGVAGTGPALVFGDNGPGVGDGTGVKFSPASSSSGQYLRGKLPPTLDLTAFGIECYVNAGTSLPSWGVAGSETFLAIDDTVGGFFAALYLNNGAPAVKSGGTSVTAGASIVDGGWHHIAATRTAASGAVTLYVDGVSAGSTASSSAATSPDTLYVGADSLFNTAAMFQGNVGEVAIYTTAGVHVEYAGHTAAINGYSGDTTDARINRFLARSNVTAVLDAGQTTVGTYPQDGKDVISACQDMATTEGGVFWFRWDGQARFANRRFRDATTPVLTLDAAQNLDATVYDPAFDESTLVNSSTASRSAESGVLSTQTYTDTVSVAAYGESDADVTTYTLSDQDALNLAQAQVAGNAYPAFRLNQVAVNCHASTTNLYAALAAVEIGSRIRIINLPAGAAPLGTVDLFVEGWREEITNSTYRVIFDTSPADNPPRWKWDTSRWQCSGQTLNTALTPSGTTVSIATTAGLPTFTTGAFYPMDIQIGQEQIRLNTAPGGSTSPQSFTGVTRGVNGTAAASQAAGSVIQLAPASAWAL